MRALRARLIFVRWFVIDLFPVCLKFSDAVCVNIFGVMQALLWGCFSERKRLKAYLGLQSVLCSQTRVEWVAGEAFSLKQSFREERSIRLTSVTRPSQTMSAGASGAPRWLPLALRTRLAPGVPFSVDFQSARGSLYIRVNQPKAAPVSLTVYAW